MKGVLRAVNIIYTLAYSILYIGVRLFIYILQLVAPFLVERISQVVLKKIGFNKKYGMSNEDFMKSNTFEGILGSCKELIQEAWYTEAFKGYKAPEIDIISLQDQHKYSLREISKPGRPLVLNFGSCTCPMFMTRLDEFKQVVEEFESTADFVTIYVTEAHPFDGWRLPNAPFQINQHKSLEERLLAAQILADHDMKCPVYVDSLNNEGNYKYGAVPNRLYILLDGYVAFQGGKGPAFYNPKKVAKLLEEWKKSDSQQ